MPQYGHGFSPQRRTAHRMLSGTEHHLTGGGAAPSTEIPLPTAVSMVTAREAAAQQPRPADVSHYSSASQYIRNLCRTSVSVCQIAAFYVFQYYLS
jgi:hypothetical protein